MTPAQAGVLAGVLVLGGVIGALGQRLVRDVGTTPGTATGLRGGGTLAELPAGPVEVRAEVIALPEGYESTRAHGGPTFTIVEAGELEVADADGIRRYRSGGFFFQPAGVAHTIRALSGSRLSVIRLLPDGAEATTEAP
ncbi:MAG: hypothetical protein IT201_02625 [Thermoleophilia bacterium]|nr:hypothetical protein [Thermoleophilia bacterium]